MLISYFVNIFNFTSGFNRKPLILIYSLTKNQAIRGGSIKALFNFIESRGIMNNSETRVLVEIRKNLWLRKYSTAKTTIDIPLRIYIDNFSTTKKIKCCISMCSRFLQIIKLQRNDKLVSLIFKEYVFDDIVYRAHNSKRIEKIITTQTNYAYQPLIFEYHNLRGNRLMIWYSANSIPLQYKKVELLRYTTNPIVYENMQIDEHWVWTKENKQYLRKFTDARILVKGSLMFYDFDGHKPAEKVRDIIIFDVTPTNDAQIKNTTIYTTSEMMNFIYEILECVSIINKKSAVHHKVFLKHKRLVSINHREIYTDFIREKVKNHEIFLVDSDRNLYNLIKSSKLVIGFPFTSPVVIARELNIPSCFYSSNKLLKSHHKNYDKSFIRTPVSLLAFMEKILAKS